MCRRPEIAKVNGVPWELFKDTKQAIAATDEMIAKNRLDFPHIDGSRDVLTTVASHITSKFYYIHVDGVHYYCMHSILRMVLAHVHYSSCNIFLYT